MITSETSYKLSEIIRDTWPNLYRHPNVFNNTKFINTLKKEKDK